MTTTLVKKETLKEVQAERDLQKASIAGLVKAIDGLSRWQEQESKPCRYCHTSYPSHDPKCMVGGFLAEPFAARASRLAEAYDFLFERINSARGFVRTHLPEVDDAVVEIEKIEAGR